MKRLRSIRGISDPYSRRILSHVLDKDVMTVLARTPRKLAGLIKGLTAKQLRTTPAKGRWNILQLVCHLTDTEIVLGFRLRMAIAQSGRPLQAIDEKKWAAGLDYGSADVAKKLALFSHLRQEHVRLLGSLSSAAWNRYGMHEERGKETITRMAGMYAGHDLNHLAQIRLLRKACVGGRR
jgi:hypothetical protein